MNKDQERIARDAIKCHKWINYALSTNNKKLWRKWNKRLSRTLNRMSMNKSSIEAYQEVELVGVKRTWIIHGGISAEDAQMLASKIGKKVNGI